MHLKELFPSDLEKCRNWQLKLIVPPSYKGGKTITRLYTILLQAEKYGIQESISTVTNDCNPIRVRLCPYVLGWQTQNEYKRLVNWGDPTGFILALQAEYGKLGLTLQPTWEFYDEQARCFDLGEGLELTETFYHLEGGGC